MSGSALAKRRLVTMPLHRRDSIGPLYHVLTFDAREPVEARAGQFAMIRSATWGQDPLLPRPMSLLTAGDRPSILIKVVGEGTLRMAHASSGEPFELLYPLGIPWHPLPAGRRAVLVAGGVGVAPLLFLARELASQSKERPLVLYGGRTHQDLPLHEELTATSELRIATEDGSRGTKGRVTLLLEQALDQLAEASTPVQVYTCGPDRMMAAVAALCAQRSVPCEVSLETPMACGYGVCLGCPVPKTGGGYLYACTEGPCIDAARISWEGHA
jgi:dihydroorotate dehydrogenase electron transfer subunit